MTDKERIPVAAFVMTQLERIRQERKRFSVNQLGQEADKLSQALIDAGTAPATAHQHVEDALRYLAFFLADSALHSKAVGVGFLLNVHRMKCEKNLGLTWKYIGKCVSRCLIGFTHRPLRLVLASVAVWLFFSILFFVLSWLDGQSVLVVSNDKSAPVPLFDYPYFSALTLTTMAYGDIWPRMGHPWAFWVALACSMEAGGWVPTTWCSGRPSPASSGYTSICSCLAVE